MQVTQAPPAPTLARGVAHADDDARPTPRGPTPRDATPRRAGSQRTGSRQADVQCTVALPSPLGPLLATATERGLARLHLPLYDAAHAEQTQHEQTQHEQTRHEQPRHEQPRHEQSQHEQSQHEQPRHDATSDGDQAARHHAVDRVLTATRDQLAAYFAGELVDFDVPLDLGGSPHQEAVWALLRAVPYGTTTTYKSIAVRLGSPGASRAVGSANARNPVAIIVPCHRVIGSDGLLTGYAAGLPHKRWLLAHEQARAVDALF